MWLVWYTFRVVTELQGQQLSLTMGFQLLVWPISVALELLQELQRHGDVSGDVSESWGQDERGQARFLQLLHRENRKFLILNLCRAPDALDST